ncbi:hypothetical protein AVEN_273809-1 [Araneus ventricosus]|uniref:Uncharacterized protein n=1 Tax=Araneus ventricosus TaxID=182803 RepID=A0A4Y2F654_ARAVE|nr:hypothetical protein AVEN_273809-1 [Araneus ventricosus]
MEEDEKRVLTRGGGSHRRTGIPKERHLHLLSLMMISCFPTDSIRLTVPCVRERDRFPTEGLHGLLLPQSVAVPPRGKISSPRIEGTRDSWKWQLIRRNNTAKMSRSVE